MTATNRYCVIMAGGIGSRFWPASRRHLPKQFLDILGTGKSFIRHTFERFAPIIPVENFLVVTNAAYRQLVLEQLPELWPEQVLCEPVGRNTAPCIAYAAFRLKALQPDSTMVVAPSDHFIFDEEEFRRNITSCMEFAETHDALVTIGIRPSRPDTGYGYIQTASAGGGDFTRCIVPRETRSEDRHELSGRRQLPVECRHLRLVGAEHPRSARTLPSGGVWPFCRTGRQIRYARGAKLRGGYLCALSVDLDRLRRAGTCR